MAKNNTSEPSLSAELLNDFYAECDEHFGAVRHALAALEKDFSGPKSIPLIEKLFRSFHSLKGIIGMVGIASAEALAHRTEDYLRELIRKQLQLTPKGLDVLARSSHAIEQTVAAFRDDQPFPSVDPVLHDIASIIGIPAAEPAREEPTPAASALPTNINEGVRAKIEEAVANGFAVWQCNFVPSAALNERGINVNAIRERLNQLGEILHAAPRISSGAMTFEFLVAVQENPSNLEEWQNDGARFEKVQDAKGGSTAAAPTVAGAPSQEGKLLAAPSQIVRVELGRLDELMRVAGELVIHRARLEEQMNRLEQKGVDVRGLHEVNLGFNRNFRELRETVMRLRMVPISEIFDRLPFVVRDLTRNTPKKVRLETRGQQTELDKFVVEKLRDPLLHLVRNSISHGIEDPEERTAQGKPAEATMLLEARTAGETVVLELSDDGRGINRDKVKARAKQMGLNVPSDLDNAGLLDLICVPGFSTKDEADRAAGRGMGMSVVYSTLQELGGNLLLESEAGKGTKFTLRLPLTLLITDALIVLVNDQRYAIPQSAVEEVLHIEEKNVRRIERAELVSVRGAALPLVRLRGVFGFPKSDRKMPSVLVSSTDRGRVGLVVDRIVGQRQVVVRSLRDPLIHVPGVIGATELGDGRPLLILDPLILVRQSSSGTVRIESEFAGNGRK